MKKQDAISHFGSKTAIARALGITRQAVQLWGDFVPTASAIALEEVTHGALKYCPDSYPESYRRPGGRLWKPVIRCQGEAKRQAGSAE